MRDTRLILVDGLPGSGKSTTAQFISLQLQRNHIPARWFYELDNSHPIHAFHVWSREGPEEFIEKTTQNWRDFVAQERGSSTVNILESTLFQSTVRLLLQSDITRQRITEYVTHIEESIQELHPIFIYFSRANVEQALNDICEKRKKTWKRYVIQVIDGSNYARKRELQDFEGMVEFFQEYQKLTTSLIDGLDMPKLVLDHSQEAWKDRQQKICDFLKLPFREDEQVPDEYLAQFTGHYKDRASLLEIRICLEHHTLIAHDLLWPTSRLIPKDENSFYVEAATIELYFQSDGPGNIHALRIGGSLGWKFSGRVLVKVE